MKHIYTLIMSALAMIFLLGCEPIVEDNNLTIEEANNTIVGDLEVTNDTNVSSSPQEEGGDENTTEETITHIEDNNVTTEEVNSSTESDTEQTSDENTTEEIIIHIEDNNVTTEEVNSSTESDTEQTSDENTTITDDNITNIETNTSHALEILKNEIHSITNHTATLNMVSNHKTKTFIEYGIDIKYGNVLQEDSFTYSDHTEVFKNLEANTLYHYKVVLTDEEGNSLTSEDKTFRTLEEEAVVVIPTPQTDIERQKVYTEKFINLFERSNPDDYGYDAYYENLKDRGERGLTVGRIFVTGSKGNFDGSDAYDVIKEYKNRGGNDKIIKTLDTRDFDVIISLISERWRDLASKSDSQGDLFRKAQDTVYDTSVYNPANKASTVLLGSALSMLNFVSAYTIHGPGEDEDSTDGMIRIAGEKTNIVKFKNHANEKTWLKAFLNERKREFCTDGEHRRALAILDTLNYLVDENDFDLAKTGIKTLSEKRDEFEANYAGNDDGYDNNKIQARCDSDYSLKEGEDEIDNDSTNVQKTVLIGARKVVSTSINKGTLFASPDGDGNDCKKETPCSIETAFSQLKAGSVLFLRGGIYTLKNTLKITKKGTADKPILVESYPGETAILDGAATKDTAIKLSKKLTQAIYIVGASYAKVRKIEIRNMPAKGIYLLEASNNTVEGCTIHDNYHNGIQIYRDDKSNNNVITDNIIYKNSDAGIYDPKAAVSYEDGDNADGISISSGNDNIITYNVLYGNSDDGIDTWKSNRTIIKYNISYDNGRGKGNGNGIKTGGDAAYFDKDALPPYGKEAVVEHNIAYNNKAHGFDVNQGRVVTFKYNTSYNNKRHGFLFIKDTKRDGNIVYDNTNSAKIYLGGGRYTDDHTPNNSWSTDAKVTFRSTDPKNKDFLRPTEGSTFENMGAFSGLYDN